MTLSNEIQKAVRFYPPSYDIRVEDVSIPQIQHPDDAIVKIKLAGLCGSDLHVYRGHEKVEKVYREIVNLGSSYGDPSTALGRPSLYSRLKLGDKVVSPFTVSCGECQPCHFGHGARCEESLLLGSPALEGAQAQFIRIPKAGGTLLKLSDASTWSRPRIREELQQNFKSPSEAAANLPDSSLLLLADILPTGLFAAMQAINHPKVAPIMTGLPWPLCVNTTSGLLYQSEGRLTKEERVLTAAVIGLGPVGVCTVVALLDIIKPEVPFKIVAVDPLELRREKMEAVYAAMTSKGQTRGGEFVVCAIDDAKEKVKGWTRGLGCNVVLEIVGNTSALSLAYELVRPFGAIISVGVHGQSPLPFTGGDCYDKNVSLDFGRCPARAMFPDAFRLLVKRQDIFGGVGQVASLVDKIVGFDEAVESYRAFDRGEVGKILFDPWK